MNKFSTQIHMEETAYEPTQADWAEYHEWLEEQEAGEPMPEQEEFQLSAPKGWDAIEADDSIGALDTVDGFDDELEMVYGVEYPSEPWDDDYNDHSAWEEYCDYE